MISKKFLERLIQLSFIKHSGFFYTKHAEARMIERHITTIDIEEAYLNGGITHIESEDEKQIKLHWEGYDQYDDKIRIVMIYLKTEKTLIVTVIGDLYEN